MAAAPPNLFLCLTRMQKYVYDFYHLLYMYVYSKKIGRRSWDLIKKEEKQKNKIENKKLRIKERIIEKGKKKKREKKKKRNERKREIALKLDKWERNATRIIIKIEKDGLTRLRRVEGVVVELDFGIEIMARRRIFQRTWFWEISSMKIIVQVVSRYTRDWTILHWSFRVSSGKFRGKTRWNEISRFRWKRRKKDHTLSALYSKFPDR